MSYGDIYEYRRRKVLTKVVRPQWYRRYAHVLPADELTYKQPIHEILQEEDMLKAMETPPVQRDRAEELARKLALERATRITTVLDILEGNTENVKEKLQSLKPMTTVLEYMTEDKLAEKEKDRDIMLRQQYFLNRKTIPPGSKWNLIKNNKYIWRKIMTWVKELRSEEIRSRWKKACRLVNACFRLHKVIADMARTTGAVFAEFKDSMQKEKEREQKEGGLVFETSAFKALAIGKELDERSQYTLRNVENTRLEEDIKWTCSNLRMLKSFAAFPANIQLIMTRIGWLITVEQDKVVIRQGQEAHYFYFLMSGKAIAVKMVGSPVESEDGGFELQEIFERDAMFGHEGVFIGRERDYSVTCVEECTLLSVNIDDYNRMCLTGTSESDNPEHIRIVSQLEFMRFFPMKKLIEDADGGNIILFYFPPGQVVARSAVKSQYILIIKTGTCQVLAKVQQYTTVQQQTKSTKVVIPPDSPPESELKVSIKFEEESMDDDTSHRKDSKKSSSEADESDVIDLPLFRPIHEEHPLGDSKISRRMSTFNVSETANPDVPRRGRGVSYMPVLPDINKPKNPTYSRRESMVGSRRGSVLDDMSTVRKMGNQRDRQSFGAQEDGSQADYNLCQRGSRSTLSNMRERPTKEVNKKGSKSFEISTICEDESEVLEFAKRSSSTRSVSQVLGAAGSIEKFVSIPGHSKSAKDSGKEWVVIRSLRESDVLGIETLDIGDTPDRPPVDVAVVSEGCEVILIDKDYFLENSSPKMRAHLRSSSYILPDEKTLSLIFRRQAYWQKFKNQCVQHMINNKGKTGGY